MCLLLRGVIFSRIWLLHESMDVQVFLPLLHRNAGLLQVFWAPMGSKNQLKMKIMGAATMKATHQWES